MARFVRLNDNNEVITAEVLHATVITDGNGKEQEQLGIDFLNNIHGEGIWKQTSKSGNFRKNYAGIGYTYDSDRDAFISPKPHPSWTLDEDTCQWDAPTAYPDDDKNYTWNEGTTSWDEVSE